MFWNSSSLNCKTSNETALLTNYEGITKNRTIFSKKPEYSVQLSLFNGLNNYENTYVVNQHVQVIN